MANRQPHSGDAFDGGSDEAEDFEDPDESDMDEDDDPALVACPFCRGEISEEAEVCPHCGNYICAEDASRRIPVWLIIGVAAGMAVVLMWLAR
jgi:hypothetical protein